MKLLLSVTDFGNMTRALLLKYLVINPKPEKEENPAF